MRSAPAQEESPPPGPGPEYMAELRRSHGERAEVLPWNGQDRILLMYRMRNQATGEAKPGSGSVLDFLDTFKDPDGVIKANPATNEIMLIADEPHMRALLAVLDRVDVPSPQVLIEAKIVEITHTSDFQWGVNIFLDKGGVRDAVTGEVGPIVATDSAYTLYRGAQGLFDPDDFLSSLAPGGAPFRGGEVFFDVAGPDLEDIGRIDVAIRALVDSGRGEILSQPSILAVTGQKATIHVGEDVPVPKVREQPQGTFTEIQFEPVGVKLEVTPQIIAQENIVLLLNPEVSFVIEFILLGQSAVVAPRISKRDAGTQISVRDGQTVVIGGLIATQENTDEVKFPVLGDIPVLGAAFKSYRKRATRTEVFFFVTPKIITRERHAPRVFDPLAVPAPGQ